MTEDNARALIEQVAHTGLTEPRVAALKRAESVPA
jgi:hypothetical protein